MGSHIRSSLSGSVGRRDLGPSRVKQAMLKEELQIYLQPKCNTKTGKLVGHEALLRWHHPNLGLILPHDFLFTLPPESALELDIWVLRQTTIQAISHGFVDLPFSINAEANSVSSQVYMDRLEEISNLYPCEVGKLEIEITERDRLTRIGDVAKRMEALIERGITFSLDDFGTGHNSLHNLSRLPIQTVKIERSFIQDASRRQEGFDLLSAFTEMAGKLGKSVLAEGVETASNMKIVRDAKIEVAQGWLFGKAVPAEEWQRCQSREQRLHG